MFILNGSTNELYDHYSIMEIAKLIYKDLKKKYDTEEAGSEKYVVNYYLRFQMRDDRSVKVQSHELQKISTK